MILVSRVLAVVLIVACTATAVGDFRRAESVLAVMARLKVPAGSLRLLGAIKIVLAAGMFASFLDKRIGEVTGVALCAYFAVAMLTHVRVKDGVRNTLPAFVLLVASIVFVLTSIAA